MASASDTITPFEISSDMEKEVEINVWNPFLIKSDAEDIMPIITPSYPQFNSAFNVKKSTLSVIKYEIHRAFWILKNRKDDLSKSIHLLYQPILDGKLIDFLSEKSTSKEYDLLLKSKYTWYIKILIESNDSATFYKWEGYVQSQLKYWSSLEIKNLDIRAFPDWYSINETK